MLWGWATWKRGGGGTMIAWHKTCISWSDHWEDKTTDVLCQLHSKNNPFFNDYNRSVHIAHIEQECSNLLGNSLTTSDEADGGVVKVNKFKIVISFAVEVFNSDFHFCV